MKVFWYVKMSLLSYFFKFLIQGSVTLTSSDVARIHPGHLFNDSLIDFGLKTLFFGDASIHSDHNPAISDQVHMFYSFFYTKLTKGNPCNGISYDEVKRWTKDIRGGLFSKRLIIIPITPCGDMHWSLAVVCNPGNKVSKQNSICALDVLPSCILHMDSLSLHDTGIVSNVIRSYLHEERKATFSSSDSIPESVEYIVIDGRDFVSNY